MSTTNSERHPTTRQVATITFPKQSPRRRYGVRIRKSPAVEMAESKHADTVTTDQPTLLPHAASLELRDSDQTREKAATKDQQQQQHIGIIQRLEQEQDRLRHELDVLGQSFQKVIQELSERHAEDQESSQQCSDSYLVERANHLRYIISGSFVSFSSLHLEGQILSTMRSSENTTNEKPKYHAHLVSTTPTHPTYLEILETGSSVGFARVLEAFVWNVLTNEVFGGFHWAGETVSSSIREIRRFLAKQQHQGSGHRPSREMELATRKWTLSTIQIIMDSSCQAEAVDISAWKQGVVEGILQVTMGGGGPGPHDAAMAGQLGEIIDVALDLDKKLSRQVTPLEWKYCHKFLERTDHQLHEEIMQVHDEDRVLLAGLKAKRNHELSKPPRVRLVVAPALVKRRDLATEGHVTEDFLLKSIVHYTPS